MGSDFEKFVKQLTDAFTRLDEDKAYSIYSRMCRVYGTSYADKVVEKVRQKPGIPSKTYGWSWLSKSDWEAELLRAENRRLRAIIKDAADFSRRQAKDDRRMAEEYKAVGNSSMEYYMRGRMSAHEIVVSMLSYMG